MTLRSAPGRFVTADGIALGLAAVVIMLAAASSDVPPGGTAGRALDG